MEHRTEKTLDRNDIMETKNSNKLDLIHIIVSWMHSELCRAMEIKSPLQVGEGNLDGNQSIFMHGGHIHETRQCLRFLNI